MSNPQQPQEQQQQQNPYHTIAVLSAAEEAADDFIGSIVRDLVNGKRDQILLQRALAHTQQQLQALQEAQQQQSKTEGQPSKPANPQQPSQPSNPDELTKWQRKAEAEERERKAVEAANAKLRETVKELRADVEARKMDFAKQALQPVKALVEIREIIGDPEGKLMQDEVVAKVRELAANQKKPRKPTLKK